jgi:membrane-associated phospholipid phosphatase
MFRRSSTEEPLLAFNLRETLNMTDLCMLSVMALYTVLALVFYTSVPKASVNILINTVIALLIIALAVGEQLHGGKIFQIARRYYPVPAIYLMYEQVHSYVPVVHPGLYDYILIGWDRAIFGVNPTQWLHQFAVPALTEYLQFTYALFYFLPVLHGVEMTVKNQQERLGQFVYIMTFGFLVSYLLYFMMPAIGPRFTLHDFRTTNLELPGLWLTSTIRELINAGGSAPQSVPDPAAVVNRDCMPSGHTMMTLLNIILAWRYRSRLRWLFYIIGGSLIFSTVYLRYHYVVDVLAGALCTVIVLYIAPRLRSWVRAHYFPQA